MLRVNGNDTDIGKPNSLPTLHFFTVRKVLWRDRLFRSEVHSNISNLRIYSGVKSTIAPVANTDQYPAIPAKKAIGRPASLAILPSFALVFDSNEQRSLRIGHIRGPVFATKIAVTAARIICSRRARKFDIHEDVAAMTSSV